MALGNSPFVSIIMPALNEEGYISAAIDSIIPQSNDIDYELLVVDGGSWDRTRAIVDRIAASNRRVRTISNDKRIQASAINLGAKLADPRAGYLVRADCHLRYPQGFVERCIKTLAERDVASVVVPMRTEGTTCMQRAIAAAQNSRLGNGGSSHRVQGSSGFVDHGHHAAFDRWTFVELGGYDESFSHNEDAELDRRIIKSGRRIYLDTQATVTYFPRTTLTSLARQYFLHGWGRAGNLLKHRTPPRIRQSLPPLVFLACLLALGLSATNSAFLVIPAAYAAACVATGLGLALQQRKICLVLSGLAATVMHMSWAAGFLLKILRPSSLAALFSRPA